MKRAGIPALFNRKGVFHVEHLPHWILTDKRPAFMESESLTAIEMVSRVYGKMNELVDDYNAFVDNTNKHIDEFINSSEKNYELFTLAMRQEFQDFIDVVELKIASQDKEIQNAIAYMKKNLNATVTALIEKAIADGAFTVGIVYDETNYSLNLSVK